jgi:hypothetical protein
LDRTAGFLVVGLPAAAGAAAAPSARMSAVVVMWGFGRIGLFVLVLLVIGAFAWPDRDVGASCG